MVIGRHLLARVHSLRQPLDNLIKLIVPRDLRAIEINAQQACGTSEIHEASSGMEIIFEMETIIFVVTGKNTFSRTAQGIGIATGTVTVTIGGMATDAAL